MWNSNQGWTDTVDQTQTEIPLLLTLDVTVSLLSSDFFVYSGIDKYGKTKLIRPAESAFIFLDELNLIDVLENGKSVRIHPLLREYVFEKLEEESSENQSTNLKVESILNLKRAYYDNFPSLIQEYVERNNDIDSIREDFETVLAWSKGLTSSETGELTKAESNINSIYELNKIIDQESHNLRFTVTNDSFSINQDKQALFAQAILIRSFDLNNMEMAGKSREFLRQLKEPFLDIRWARVRNKGALIRTLEGHSSSVKSVAITTDNSKIVSAAGDKTIKVWDMNTGKLLNTLEGHSHYVYSIAITTDNSKIVPAAGDSTIKLWDLHQGKYYLSYKFDAPVLAIAFSKSKSLIALGDESGNLYAGTLFI